MEVSKLENNEFNISLFLNFVIDTDKDFTPPLSQTINLRQFVSKVLEKGNVIVIKNNKDIIGALTYYSNNIEESYGYISYVAIKKSMRGKELSKILLNEAIHRISTNGIETIGIHTNNPIALKLYTSHGFQIVKETLFEFYTRYYLEYHTI